MSDLDLCLPPISSIGANLTRCQEDRAAALAKSRRQTQAPYMPECSENGAFLEEWIRRELHGKMPILLSEESMPLLGFGLALSLSLRAMYNPNEPSSLTQGAPCSSKFSHSLDREDDIKPSVIAAFHLFSSLNAEEGVAPRPTQPSPVPHRPPGIHEARQHQQEGTFIPECEGDGTYKEVQCHQATGYCWCVRVDTGRPIPGTSTRSVPYLS
ncbi:SPARC-related modular calcium-binding protein 2, partial [Ophiophagus hannah]